MAEHRKNKKEAKERLLELLKNTNAPGFNIAERGYHVSLAKRKSKKAANANLVRARCLEWRGGSGEDLFHFLTAPVVVETQSLQRSAKDKTGKGGRKKNKQAVVESDNEAGNEEEDEEEDEEELAPALPWSKKTSPLHSCSRPVYKRSVCSLHTNAAGAKHPMVKCSA